jgi:hypothetical protein
MTGVTACGSDSGTAGTAAASNSADDAKRRVVPTKEQLTGMLLTAGETPSGYRAEDERAPRTGRQSSDNKVAPEACGSLIDGTFAKDAPAAVERPYQGESELNVVSIALVGDGHDELVRRLESVTDTLRACAKFEQRDGNDSWTHEITGVKTGTFGADSVSWQYDYFSEGRLAHRSHSVMVVTDTVAVTVTVTVDPDRKRPDAPTDFVKPQLAKIAATDWADKAS